MRVPHAQDPSPLVLFAYLRTTWSHYGASMRYLEMIYKLRLGKCANGYLVLLAAGVQAGDKVVLIEQGRVTLALRRRPERAGYNLGRRRTGSGSWMWRT